MKATITIHKAQGENRRHNAAGLVEETQYAKYYAVLRSPEGHVVFNTGDKSSVPNIKKHIARLGWPLIWRGTPDREGVYGMATIEWREIAT